mgnify:CR=1 FL=1
MMDEKADTIGGKTDTKKAGDSAIFIVEVISLRSSLGFPGENFIPYSYLS